MPVARRRPWTRWPLVAAWAVLVLLAAALRLPGLGALPPGLHPDEAANAADALSSPLALCYAHEGGGWVEGIYVWLAAPGLRLAAEAGASLEAAVRLPAALAGVALVPAVALLAMRVAGRSAGLLAGLLLAGAPWAVHHSRLGLRGTLVAPLLAWGLWCWLRAAEDGAGPRGEPRWRFAGGGALLLGLAALTYPPARLVLPLLALSWVACERRGATRVGWVVAAGPLLACALLLPWTLGTRGGERLRDVLSVGHGGGWLPDLGHALRGWALHFGPRFLWSGASSVGFAPEGVGLLPRLSAPLLGVGLIVTLARRDRWRPRLLTWLALAPLAAALTRDTPNPLRAAPLLPALALIAACGLGALLRAAPAGAGRRALRALLAGLLAAAALSGAARYAHLHAVREARFYAAGRDAALRAVAREGRAVVSGDRFLGAYARLYAPGLALAREPDGGWRLGSRADHGLADELLLLELGPVAPRASDRVLVPGVAWLRRR